ncbi:unnamed protein product [Hyaloperonospora brassicae]|uniref:PX domain-containing protein n=1 Tax=Hyaloperonospora brassicae TaxID=162125 RepID=A0AAV0UGS3_HYABA|nr:unnamed protein product [Hyaloperonospora brassicae]
MNLRGLSATVTSCVGGPEAKFAVQVRPPAPARVYFVYKTVREFDALWNALRALAQPVPRPYRQPPQQQPQQQLVDRPRSGVAAWLAQVVDHCAFRALLADLRTRANDTRRTLNVLLQFLVARVSALLMEQRPLWCPIGRALVRLLRAFLRAPAGGASPATCGALERSSSGATAGGRKRSLDEMRPEDGQEQRRSLFPTRSGRTDAKSAKLCGRREWVLPSRGPMGLVAPVTSRRRVFAEVEF